MLFDAQIREKNQAFLNLISTHLIIFKWTSHKLQQSELNNQNMFSVYEEENGCWTYLTLQKSILDILLNSCHQHNIVLTACMNCLSISDGEQQVLHNLLISHILFL